MMMMIKSKAFLATFVMGFLALLLAGCNDDDSCYCWDESFARYHHCDSQGRKLFTDHELQKMAELLCNHWAGTLNANSQQDDGQWVEDGFNIEWIFTATKGKIAEGRGQEVVLVNGEQGGIRPFAWVIESNGDIRLVYDDGVEMLIPYSELNLTNRIFHGIMQGVNVVETDLFRLSVVDNAHKTSDE